MAKIITELEAYPLSNTFVEGETSHGCFFLGSKLETAKSPLRAALVGEIGDMGLNILVAAAGTFALKPGLAQTSRTAGAASRTIELFVLMGAELGPKTLSGKLLKEIAGSFIKLGYFFERNGYLLTPNAVRSPRETIGTLLQIGSSYHERIKSRAACAGCIEPVA